MPFKDNADLPDRDNGWNDKRSMLLGKDMLYPIIAVLNHLNK
jgi:murein tripeptide amidase MpaA